MKFSGYGHKKELARLFHAWLDCFVLLKIGATEVCALGMLLVIIVIVIFIILIIVIILSLSLLLLLLFQFPQL